VVCSRHDLKLTATLHLAEYWFEMIPFHTLCPDLAQREVRVLLIGGPADAPPGPMPPAGEYAFVEFYCEDLDCDCRRAFLQVMAKNQAGRVFASINCGWEKESFYRKTMPWDKSAPKQVVRGSLDPLNAQSEYAQFFLEAFQKLVWDESYRLRLQRHHQVFREELKRQFRKQRW